MSNRRVAIFLGGGQGSGKTSGAQFITNQLSDGTWVYDIIKFADPLYQISQMVDKFYSGMVGRDPSKKNGPLLQRMGDIGRELYNEDIFVNDVTRRVCSGADGLGHSNYAVIIEDVRYGNELSSKEALRDIGWEVVSILFEAPLEIRKARAESFRENTSHSSESTVHQIRHLFDFVIDTSGDISDKNTKIAGALKSINVNYDPRRYLEFIVNSFNSDIEDWQNESGHGANFEWYYDKDTGRKKLRVRDVAPIETLPADKAAIKISEVQEKMESLDVPK